MLKRLLVPLDGSALAEAALPLAARMARALQGTLILFQTYDVLPSDIPLRVIETEAAETRAYLAEVAGRPELTGIAVETYTLGGSVTANLLDALSAYQVDLVIMSSHGRAGFTRWTLGSVTEQVIRRSPVPVLVLHGPKEGELPHQEAPVGLVALDGSELAENALAPAAEVLAALAAPDEGTLHLVRVVPPPAEISMEETAIPLFEREDKDLRVAEEYLLALSARIQQEGLAGHHPIITWSLHISDEVTSALARAEERADQDGHAALFLALATHGRGMLERWTSGSIAVDLIEHTTHPLLIIRARHEVGNA